MRNAGLDEAQAGVKIARRNIDNLRYADDTTLMAESAEELKSLLMKVREESEKVGLILNIQKSKIMASGPITSWQIDRETMETVRDFLFLDSKITPDGDCSLEIKEVHPWKQLWDYVSAITQEPNENTFAFLESLKKALQKFTNLDLDSYKGQVILKDKFLSQCASDIRIKLPTVIAAGSYCLFR